jgi:hypothetical protein
MSWVPLAAYSPSAAPRRRAASGAGTWHAVLELDEKLFDRQCKHSDAKSRPAACEKGSARYSLSALAWSNLRLRASLAQSSLVPGATLTITASLDEYDVPVDHRASVVAEVTDPSGASAQVGMAETQPGRFQAATIAALDGVYPIRVTASGVTFSGTPFSREQTLTGAVFHGGDQPLPTTPPADRSPLCCIIESLTGEESVRRYLDAHGLDAHGVRSPVVRSPAVASDHGDPVCRSRGGRGTVWSRRRRASRGSPGELTRSALVRVHLLRSPAGRSARGSGVPGGRRAAPGPRWRGPAASGGPGR